MTDDETERDFWTPSWAARPTPGALRPPGPGAACPSFGARGVETALEVGPGWGNYTLTLAELCREVACVDISRDVLDFILRIGEERGRAISPPSMPSGRRSRRRAGTIWCFGYNCFYRQADLADCFRRMDRAADKLCVAGMNTGLAPAWLHELDAAGGRVSWEWKDYIYFVGCSTRWALTPM